MSCFYTSDETFVIRSPLFPRDPLTNSRGGRCVRGKLNEIPRLKCSMCLLLLLKLSYVEIRGYERREKRASTCICTQKGWKGHISKSNRDGGEIWKGLEPMSFHTFFLPFQIPALIAKIFPQNLILGSPPVSLKRSIPALRLDSVEVLAIKDVISSINTNDVPWHITDTTSGCVVQLLLSCSNLAAE